MKIYLAGKVDPKNDWRSQIANTKLDSGTWYSTSSVLSTRYKGVTIVGPFTAFGCDQHCCNPKDTTEHGTVTACLSGNEVQSKNDVLQKDLLGIRRCDMVFCWGGFDFETAHGTHVELGMARALGKYIVLARSNRANASEQEARSATWFAEQTASLVISGRDPVAILDSLVKLKQVAA